MHRNGHPWTPRRTIAVSLSRSHDGESRRPPLTPNIVGFDRAPRGIGETRRGKEERWTAVRPLNTAWGTWGTHALALADQAIVSGASFLTTVLIARWTFPSELGLYSIAISLLISSFAIQESLISLPYTIQQGQSIGTRAEHAGSALALCGLLSALGIVALALTALGMTAGNIDPKLVAMIWVLAAIAPFALVREFGRQFAFAHLRTGQALILDAAVATIQLAGLGWLGWTGRISGAAACAVLGFACALVAMVWLYLAHRSFAIRWQQISATMLQSWTIGKWLFANQITVSVQGYVAYWLLAALAGMTATGVYAACMSVVLFANPLIMGLGNILTPRSVLALRTGGSARLRLQVIRDSLLLGAAMTLFCLLVLFAGEGVLRLLYHGDPYVGHGHTLLILALAMLLMAIGMPAGGALSSMQRPREVFWTGLFGAVVTILLVWQLAAEHDVLGAAYGFLAGNAARSAARLVVFVALIPKTIAASDSAAPDSNSVLAIRVLRQFTKSSNESSWAIEQLGEGGQAHVFVIRSLDQQPLWHTHGSLVIKLYKPAATQNSEVAGEQFYVLSLLHAALDGRIVDGWKIFVPKPLYICASPLALVMTAVPGRALSLCLGNGDRATSEMLESAPRAVGSAMEVYWSANPSRRYGELCFDNILYDAAVKSLSFIDPGGPNVSLHCGVTGRWYPASHDLAYLLYDTATNVKGTLGNPRARLHQQVFTENLLRAFVETIGPSSEKRSLLDEIDLCAQAHVRQIGRSLSPRGLWHVVLRQVAFRRIDKFLEKLRTDAGAK
jgi:O-antigen/teichoic acid export membrane protein